MSSISWGAYTVLVSLESKGFLGWNQFPRIPESTCPLPWHGVIFVMDHVVLMTECSTGGKVTVLGGGADTPFSAVSIVHPAMLSVEDSEKLTIPLAIYPSKDEPYNKILAVLEKKEFSKLCDSKHYTNMHHGWAAARANLEDEANMEEFVDVYTRIIDFFCKALPKD
ncbi:hypothetical protein D9757_006252 [Collybiopsis confluens]|uniref:Dienelactone hydrolase domain-containing protein n=1 Tax=Collybiopsis confluens TaxID=2823264 RepID=A0A8H5M8L8_9AGAR|nr:hypothetical protein D9757_006252 [Collybiopsis confluens]